MGNSRIKENHQDTFVLVHGAWHGGWCWEEIEPRLQALGYQTLAPDLPGHGENTAPLAEQTLDSYAEAVVRILDEMPEPVILVGHSMGGPVVTMAAERRPEKVKKLIYMAAFMLKSGQSVNGLDNGIRPIDLVSRSQNGRTAPWSEAQIRRFTVDCGGKDLTRVYERLCEEAIAPLTTGVQPTPERWGSIRRFYIACTDDMAATPEAVEEMLKNNPCEDVYYLKADHLAFYSAPDELTALFDKIAGKP